MVKILAALCWLILACIPNASEAGSLEVSPTLLQFVQGQSHRSIRITNRGKSPIIVQVRAFRWEQEADSDQLLAAPDMVISPPIFTLQPGTTQTLRVMRRNTVKGQQSQSFRLLVDDITPPPTGHVGAHMAIRLSLPVFSGGGGSALAKLRWGVESGPAGATLLSVTNDGTAYENIRQLEVEYADGDMASAMPVASNTYILPGATRHWVVSRPHQPARAPTLVIATTSAGVVSRVAMQP